MLHLPVTNFVSYSVASANEMFIMWKKIELAGESPLLGQLSPPANTGSQKKSAERTSQVHVS